MVDLPLKDTKATGGGCGCGCGGHDTPSASETGASETAASATAASETTAAQGGCDCGPDCTCGCQDGKPCTCGNAQRGVKESQQSAPLAGAASGDAAESANAAVYTVSGMTCEHCVKAVTEEVSAIDGVTGVKVDLESGRLEVTSDAPVDFDRIVEAVSEAGDYTVE